MELIYSTSTKEKALAINREPKIYGSFAEIGAGQETGRWFFRVGGASSTIAKTISAYDMVFSDAIYGAEESKRYVCEARLVKMLSREFRLMQERLTELRPDTRFFAFANTVAAKSSRVTQNWNGWLGVRFQTKPKGEFNDLVVHVRMMDHRNHLQQEALGILGVNMIYGVFNMIDQPEIFVRSLMDGIEAGRLEIDLVKFQGPDVSHIDNRILGFHLVEEKFTDAVLFMANGDMAQPSDVLYGKNILLQRGNFRPVNNLNLDMLRCGADQFKSEFKFEDNQLIVVPELNVNRFAPTGKIDAKDFLSRIDLLAAMGYPVLVSKYVYYHDLRRLLSRCTSKKIGIIMGVGHLNEIFDEKLVPDIEGGLLESLGKLFNGDVKLYVYPAHSLSVENPEKIDSKNLFTAANFKPLGHLEMLYRYFCENNKVESLRNFDTEVLHINSRTLYKKVSERSSGWEQGLPAKIAKLIKDKKLFMSWGK